MLNLLKRAKNLWKLSALEIPQLKDEVFLNAISDKPRMAKIISMRDNVKEILKNDETIRE